jgi:hypothetical protein
MRPGVFDYKQQTNKTSRPATEDSSLSTHEQRANVETMCTNIVIYFFIAKNCQLQIYSSNTSR